MVMVIDDMSVEHVGGGMTTMIVNDVIISFHSRFIENINIIRSTNQACAKLFWGVDF